LFLLIELIMLI